MACEKKKIKMKGTILTIIFTCAFCIAIVVIPYPFIKDHINPVRIVVDEETLIQYIQWNGSMTVRVKEDGTPYTIDRENLDKYKHFMFGEKGE